MESSASTASSDPTPSALPAAPPAATDSTWERSEARKEQCPDQYHEANTIAGGMAPLRKRLNASDRIILCTEVDAIRPFTETRGRKGIAWSRVAANCMNNPNFGVKTNGKMMQEAFNNMIKAVREDKEAVVCRSGNDKEYSQLRRLLTGLSKLVDELEREQHNARANGDKQERVEGDASALRDIATDSLKRKNEADNGNSFSPSTVSKRCKRTVDDIQQVAENTNERRRVEADANARRLNFEERMLEEQTRIWLAVLKATELQNKKLDILLAEMESRREDAKIERRMLMTLLEKICSNTR